MSTIQNPDWVECLLILMPKESDRIQLLQGILDMLILRALLFGPAHGDQIAKHIQRTTEDLPEVEHGSLYPALHRLERKGWVAAKWKPAGKDLKREFKYYSLTPAGKKQLVAESRSGRNSPGPWRASCGLPRRSELSLWKRLPRWRPTSRPGDKEFVRESNARFDLETAGSGQQGLKIAMARIAIRMTGVL
jgi:PadR family transcriptional regulator, regulatory protein PadR